ncbi:hypothetical protein [Clostridium sp.]|uniref:hypothetical protein n=1 Tax=Clostridium sp. TaxID=1506 RepID=UPI002845F808|nr:hypothetical protein [Clostridium sp.]MDR3596533.1 hypothetical protein [Clostridium sp.]
MSKIKICNGCHEIFKNASLKEFDLCPECKKGEIIFFEEDEISKIYQDEEKIDDFKASLVEYGSPDSQRELDLSCTFEDKTEAENCCIEIENKSPFCYVTAHVVAEGWKIRGSATVKLCEINSTIAEVESIIQRYHTYQGFDWISVHF